MSFVFAVQEQGKEERIKVDADRVRIGSGAHCDIRLASDVAAWEHVIVTREEDGAVARVVASDAVVTFDGTPRRETRLASGTTMCIDTVTIRVELDATAVAPPATRPARQALRIAGVFLLAVLVGVIFARRSQQATANTQPTVIPTPLKAPVTTCPDHENAAALAEQTAVVADAKRRRFYFRGRDGVEAVPLFEVAGACFRVAQDFESAIAAERSAGEMRRRIEDELRGARLRLERAMTTNDAKSALAQLKLLRELLAEAPAGDPYVAWLAVLQSKIEAQLSKG